MVMGDGRRLDVWLWEEMGVDGRRWEELRYNNFLVLRKRPHYPSHGEQNWWKCSDAVQTRIALSTGIVPDHIVDMILQN